MPTPESRTQARVAARQQTPDRQLARRVDGDDRERGAHGAGLRQRLRSVGDEIADHLVELRRVSHHDDRRGREVQVQRDVGRQ